MPRRQFTLIAFLLILFSCSKEEDIPFIAEDRDTLDTKIDYLKLDGTYKGLLSNITFVNDSVYDVDFSTPHTIRIEEIDFSTIVIKNITNVEQADAVSSIQRFVQGDQGAFIIMEKTINNVIPIKLFLNEFNGIYFKQPAGQIQYFITYTDKVDTISQLFDGQFIE